MQFRDFLDIIRSRWKILAASILLVVGTTLGVSFTITPTYEANARFLFATTAGGYAVTAADLQTYVELLRSPVLLEPLRETLDLPPGTPVDVTGTVAEDTKVLAITARASTPQLAADIANEVGPELAGLGVDMAPYIATAGQEVVAAVIVPASPPGAPASPNIPRNAALSLLAGIALGLGLVLLRHSLDTRVRIEADVKTLSTRPILGSLRRLRDPANDPLIVESEPHGVAAEEFRRLRTNLQFVDVTTGGKHSFAVTSASPSEGKTLTAINLALAMADSGVRVLLVDADLRHPSVASTFGLSGAVGLTTLLLGRSSLDEVVQPWRNTTLDVLPAGQIPPNPSELLASAAMRVLFEEFLREYDFVVVDSPPVIPVVDPVQISGLVGGLLMVVCVDRTKKRDLSHALRTLRTVEVEPAGFALNMVQGGDGYGRYGSYSYYAYGQDAKGKRKKRAKKRDEARPSSRESVTTPEPLPGRETAYTAPAAAAVVPSGSNPPPSPPGQPRHGRPAFPPVRSR